MAYRVRMVVVRVRTVTLSHAMLFLSDGNQNGDNIWVESVVDGQDAFRPMPK